MKLQVEQVFSITDGTYISAIRQSNTTMLCHRSHGKTTLIENSVGNRYARPDRHDYDNAEMLYYTAV